MQVFEQVNQIAIRVWKSMPTGVDSVVELQRDNEALNQVREERLSIGLGERVCLCFLRIINNSCRSRSG